LVHAAINKAAKGGGAIHSTPDLILVVANTGSQSQTSDGTLASLSPVPEGNDSDPRDGGRST
jgi:hypothetical protein